MPDVLETVLIDRELVPVADARIPVLDRGFLYGDAVYEVIAVYHGTPFLLQRHLARLARSLDRVRCANPLSPAAWEDAIANLLRANAPQLPSRAAVYLQVSRGSTAGRDHVLPAGVTPRLVGFCMHNPPPADRALSEGIEATLLEDLRWRACDVKATSLLANVLAREEARARGADEALLHRDGLVFEGSSSNLLIWRDGGLVSPPDGPNILPGVTRDWVLDQAQAAGVPCRREAIPLATLRTADEVWITSTTREVLPVTRIDGEAVGDGRPGAYWRAALARLHASLPP